MENKRFNELMTRYKEGTLNRTEYEQFLQMLGSPDSEAALNKILDTYWEAMDDTTVSPGSEIQEKRKGRFQRHIWYWGAAASVVVLLGLFFVLKGTPDIFKNHEMVYHTGYGERLEVVLNDGSQVTLNANSTLKWSNDWRGNQSREVILEGEAFFQVVRNEEVPFTVHTEDVAVEVLGTSFNVDSRDTKTEVYLEEGKVNLKLLKMDDPEQPLEEKQILMNPGDQISYSALENTVVRTGGQTMITAAAWKHNVLNFKNMKFSDVLNLLREIYGQSFECSDAKLLNTPMYLGVPYSDWDAVRQALELSLNIEFEKTANRRYVVQSVK